MTEIKIEADDAGRYWLDIEIGTVPVKAYVDTGLIGAVAPRIMLTKALWTKVEGFVHSIKEFRGVDGQGNPWLVKQGLTKVRIPNLGMEFVERVGGPANDNVIGSLFFDNLKSYEVVIDCGRRVLTVRTTLHSP